MNQVEANIINSLQIAIEQIGKDIEAIKKEMNVIHQKIESLTKDITFTPDGEFKWDSQLD